MTTAKRMPESVRNGQPRMLPIDQVAFLRSVGPQDLLKLERLLPALDWAGGDSIPSALTQPDHLFVVRRGRIAILGQAPGGSTEMMIALAEPGDVFSTLGGVAAPSAIALEDSTVTPMSGQTLRALAGRYPESGIDLAETLSERISLLRDVVASVGQMHADDRLWARIVALTERMGVATHAGAELRLALTHAQWAQLTGASRESVTLALGRFRREGRITMDGRHITVPWDAMEEPRRPRSRVKRAS